MWEINYENPYKLHMSIGLGLILAGFLLILTNIITSPDKVAVISEEYLKTIPLLKESSNSNITDNLAQTSLELLKRHGEFIIDNSQFILKIGMTLVIGGFFIFLLGYIPFIRKHNKEIKK